MTSSSLSPTPPGAPSLTVPLGLIAPIFATALLQTFSQAILFSQLYTYLSSPRLSRLTDGSREHPRKIVYVLLASGLAGAQTARYIYIAHLAVDEQTDPLTIRSRWLEPLLTAIISCLVRLFFIYRVYRMVPKLLLAASLLFAQALILTCQIWLTVRVFCRWDSRYILAGDLAFDLSTVGSLILDIVLAIILCVSILRSRTGITYLDRSCVISYCFYGVGLFPLSSS